MSNTNKITSVHVEKLGHRLDEIRTRALENIITKLDHGFGCYCDGVKRELLSKLLNWFTFETTPHIENVLDLINRLIITNQVNINSFGKQRFHNELAQLKARIEPTWHNKISKIEEAAHHQPFNSSESIQEVLRNDYCHSKKSERDIINISTSPLQSLDKTIDLELTLPSDTGTPISKKTEGAIRWLVMPWQPLTSSDRGVLSAIEEALNSSLDTNLVITTCHFVMNVMLQDFPAEVFLQRPSIVLILQSLLQSCVEGTKPDAGNIIPIVLRVLYKLTRSLRFRIYYYCDPCIANRKQRDLGTNLNNSSPCSEDRESSEGGLPEANYQAYQSAAMSDRSQSVFDNVDETILQLQQMLIPMYCIETLNYILSLLSVPVDSSRPLRDIKTVMDLSSELVELLTVSVMPSIWLCTDEVSRKIHKYLKLLMNSLGDVLECLRSYYTLSQCRITYLHLICIITKLLSSLVPLELAELVVPDNLKLSISASIMDAPIYLMHPELNMTLHEYARQFRGTDKKEYVKLFDDTRMITKSMKAAISLLKTNVHDQVNVDILKTMYVSKSCLSYHRNILVIKQYFLFLQNINQGTLEAQDRLLAAKLLLYLLANGDEEVRVAAYTECHQLVCASLGLEPSGGRYTWTHVSFLFDSNVLVEIICHGISGENSEIQHLSEDILLYILKGRVQLGENGWMKLLEALIPVFPLLQCLADTTSPLGQSALKMLDPDVCVGIQLPYLEILKSNLRLMFASDNAIREEASRRLIYLLGEDKNSSQKLPRLTSLHGLPLGSIFIFERQLIIRRPEGNYQRSSLLSVLEMLKMPNVEPKVRKSALVQVSVMLTDLSLHKIFMNESGLKSILEILERSLTEKDFQNYPDSVIPILTILKLITSTQSLLRHELSNNVEVFVNVLRSVFLFPNNELIKMDAAHLLFILLYNDYILQLSGTEGAQLSVSLPHLVAQKMKCPFVCKTHWKTSIHRKSDALTLYANNPDVLMFLRQFWCWEWAGGDTMLWMPWENINDPAINERLMIQKSEFDLMRYTSVQYFSELQLFNITNSSSHDDVACALDFLWMYVKLSERMHSQKVSESLKIIAWPQSFERFLLSHPTSKDDCDLFVEILNFLYVHINITKDKVVIEWLGKTMKNMTKSLSDLLRNLDTNNQEIHQSVLKLVRACSSLEKPNDPMQEGQDMWNDFIELVVSNLCSSDQQHFYNLVYLDWLLTCLTYLTNKYKWSCHKDLLLSLGHALIELIISFHGNGAVSFMGLSITRNSVICLNHLLQYMQTLPKSVWQMFWYDEIRTLNWLPTLWKNRDPLVRASALQLLSGLLRAPHVAQQLLGALVIAPSDLCQTLLRFVTNCDESCIVREHACLALAHLIRNSNNSNFQYTDSLQSNAILIYVEQMNVYYEISLMCSNVYLPTSLDSTDDAQGTESDALKLSLIPKNVLQFYNCYDELLMLSTKDSLDENSPQCISTPSLITSVCSFLNHLVIVGGREIVNKIYEHSLDKYFAGCFGTMPRAGKTKRMINQACDILEMYLSICTILTNCITHCEDFAAVVNFSPDFLYLLFSYLNEMEYNEETSTLIYLRTKLWREVFNLLNVLSLTESQHKEALKTAMELAGPDVIVKSISNAINHPDNELRMSAVACLAFFLSQEIQREEQDSSLGSVLDITLTHRSSRSDDLREVLSSVNKLTLKHPSNFKRSYSGEKENSTPTNESLNSTVAAEICQNLMHFLIAHNYAKSKKHVKMSRNKDLIIEALSSLLCVSQEAKKTAITENLAGTCILVLKELYTELNLQPYIIHKTNSEREKKVHPLLNDIKRVLVLLMNFAHNSLVVKSSLSQSGLADTLHKLWVWISLNDSTLVSALKLMATFTTNFPQGAQSLTLTTTLPGTGPRKTPNTISLIHVIVHLVSKEIEKAGQSFNNQRLHFAFHLLRNTVHVHECRVSIAKSNLLQFFTKIHPTTTKRAKPWPLIEVYCLEFLIDFTFYEEGQQSVSKAIDGLDVLIHLSRCNTAATRILALSTLRNLVFNASNRPRILSSVEFANLLHSTFKSGSFCEIGIAGSMLWSLVANNQKGKLMARTSGLAHSIQEVLGRLLLMAMPDKKSDEDLAKMLQYVLKIISTSDVNGEATN